MKIIDQNTPVEVFRGSSWEAGMVKSLLENAEIEAFLKDEITGILAPWQITSGGVGSVKVVVSNADFERAQQVVTEFNQSRTS